MDRRPVLAVRRTAPTGVIAMIRRLMTLAGILAILGAQAQAQDPELARLKHHVEVLASPEFGGRRGDGAIKSRTYLIDEFRRLKLEPLFDGVYTQDVTGKAPGEVLGVNVGARLVGSDPKLRDRWIILGAHYDHLGQIGPNIYPGADDNASGVAMMLEVARSVVESGEKPKRSLMFVGFDLEERGPKGEFGLRGSQFFAAHPPVPIDKVALFVTADMIGRALGGVCERDVFILGSERVPEVRPWIARAAEGQPVKVALLGADMLVIDRSDYGPFRSRKVPFLFFTTGESPLYHSPLDRADTINYPKLEAISRIVDGVVKEAARSDLEPTWSATPVYPVAEALAVRDTFRTLLDHSDALKIGAYQLLMMRQTIKSIDGIAERGVMTGDERSRIVRVAQVVLFTVF